MSKAWRLLFVLTLIGGAYGLRAPWLAHDIWNLDEGSTFTMAEQVLHGEILYRNAADNRSPLVPYLKAAVFAVCGDWNAHAVHVAVAFMIGIAATLVWLMARRLGDEKTGVAGALFFSVLTFVMLGVSDGLSAHTGWFVVFFSTVGYWLFAHAQARPDFRVGAAVGASFGLAALCKQPGVLDLGVTVVLLGLLWFAEPGQRRARWRLLAGECAGFAVIMAAMVVYFAWHHALDDLALYAWTFNTKYYVPEVPFLSRMWAIRIPFQLAFWNMPVALVAGVTGAALMLRRVWRGLRQRPVAVPLLAWLILGWTASGLAATMISGREFGHYSAQAIPGLSLACGWAVARVVEFLARVRRARLWARVGGCGLVGLMLVAAAWDIGRRARELSKNDDDSKRTGRAVQQFTTAADPIFVWGYVPEIYFFSQRLPSTRFIYTNYLSGMIAWTNLDMLVDTSYAVVPGAWQHFWEDFERRPPALIVDTGGVRGYLKYPLHAQKKLWDVLTHDYAAVDDSTVSPTGVRLYRRLVPLSPEPSLGDAVQNERIALAASETRHGGQVPVLTVHAPTGTAEIIVYQGGRPYRRVLYASTEPCEAAFFVEREDLRTGATRFHVAVRGAKGWEVSRAIDLSDYRQLPPKPVLLGPKIKLGDRELLPVEAETIDDPYGIAYHLGRRWSAHAPSRFVYECPSTMTKLTFGYGLDEESYPPAPRPGTNGVTVVISLETPDAGTTRLFRRQLDPRAVGKDQGTQTSQVDIPAHQEGRLILQVLPGPMNDSSYDWAYWSDLVGQELLGPDLLFEGRAIPATAGEMFGRGLIHPIGRGRWSVQSPARLVYPYVEGMSSLIFSYGLEESAYDPARGAGTDGVEIMVEFEHPDHRLERLCDRQLDPRNRPTDRGPQASRVDLPRETGGSIIIRVGPGPRNDTAFDWAYLAPPRAEGSSLAIVWGGQALAPIECQTFTGPTLKPDENDHWRAHAPSRLFYQRPPEMAAMSFGYGLDARTYENADPAARTDGVDVLVQFEDRDGRVTTLFSRNLDPVNNPGDRGTQTARVELPPRAPGRLLFIFTPGPRNSNAYDWSYWTNFIGEP